VVIKPINGTLLSSAPLSDEDTRRLLQRWGRLHTVRTLLGGAGVLAFLGALGSR
jgi:Anthrone oxygenase